VTASDDHTAQIWDPRSGLKLSPPLQHPTNLTRAIFSPDGRRVLTACIDGTARVWEFPRCDWPVEDLRLLAQALSGRSIDATGNAVVLAPAVLQADLAKLRTKQPDYFRKGAKVTKAAH
jgi:WD40 repeat protein